MYDTQDELLREILGGRILLLNLTEKRGGNHGRGRIIN